MKKGLLKTVLFLKSEEEARTLCHIMDTIKIHFQFTIVRDMDQFISVISKEQVDCFILDWQLEHITDLTLMIRKSDRFRQTPIALVVDLAESSIPLQYSALKLDMTITRPFHLSNFQNQFLAILEKKLSNVIPEHFEVLIMDDRPEILEIHEENLKELHHTKYETCTSVTAAKKLVNEKEYDLLLLDWNLGDGTCIDLIEYIRANKQKARLNNALIMVVTGRDSVEDIMTLLEYDVKDYMIKPYGFREFEDKLIYALDRHHKAHKECI